MKFLACCVLPDKKLYGNCAYWCKYIRDFDCATQWLKATVPDRRVWLPAPACVINAVRLSKALKDAHSRSQAICTSMRPASTVDYTSGNEKRTQNSCACVPIRIVSYLQWFRVNQLKKTHWQTKILGTIWTNSDCPNGAWNLCQICFIVTLVVNCLDKELLAYKTLFFKNTFF